MAEATNYKKLLRYGLLELGIFIALLAADILTKVFIYDGMVASGKDIILIDGVLRFTPTENTGASFGLLQGKTTLLAIVSVISLILLAGLIVYTIKNRNPLLRASLLLILSGGLGNQIDRLTFGYVKDFVYFELIDYAVFNFADAALVVGTILLILYILIFYNSDAKKKTNKKIYG